MKSFVSRLPVKIPVKNVKFKTFPQSHYGSAEKYRYAKNLRLVFQRFNSLFRFPELNACLAEHRSLQFSLCQNSPIYLSKRITPGKTCWNWRHQTTNIVTSFTFMQFWQSWKNLSLTLHKSLKFYKADAFITISFKCIHLSVPEVLCQIKIYLFIFRYTVIIQNRCFFSLEEIIVFCN